MNSPVSRFLALVTAILAMVLTAGEAPGAIAWRDVTSHTPQGRTGHAMAYDSHRERVVMFGGEATLAGQVFLPGETWEWDGTDWELVATSGPAGLWRGAMAYDSGRQRIVLFGGESDTGLSGATWEWDGATWQEVSTAGPAARSGHAMVYDSVRQRTVLFGGRGVGENLLSDTWEWDGSNWEQVATTGPSPRNLHAMAFDAGRGVAVLFGGAEDGQSSSGETWEWDGDEWEQVATTGPSARSSHAMAYDAARGVTVLQGGATGGNETWEWNGTAWQQRQVNAPRGPGGHSLAFDAARGHIVRIGGAIPRAGASPPFAGTWIYAGSQWEKVAGGRPLNGHGAAIAWDDARGSALMFGGISGTTASRETWRWDGQFWERQPVVIAPPARHDGTMAYDPVRDRIVLFGGEDAAENKLGDTWEWTGNAWEQMSPPVQPPPVIGHRMVWDGNSETVLLFGGVVESGFAGSTWQWDGSEWTMPGLTVSPSARASHAMAWDGTNQQVVLHGGASGSVGNIASDIWVWDGTSWDLDPGSGTLARAGHTMVHNSRGGGVYIFGGSAGAGILNETWSWDGSEWVQQQTLIDPPPRINHVMTYDPYHDQLMIHGGRTPGNSRKAEGPSRGSAATLDTLTPVYTTLRDTWVLGPPYDVPPGAREAGDFNNDGCVNFQDFVFLLDNWGEEIDGEPLNFQDFVALLDNWGEGC